MNTTVGQVLVNSALPEDLRDYSRTLDKKATQELLRQIAKRYPERYSELAAHLMRVGADAAYTSGFSLSLNDLKPSETKQRVVADVRKRISRLAHDRGLSPQARNDAIVKLLVSRLDELRSGTFDESVAEGNRFARAILSGARGNKAQLSSLRGADLLLVDHKDRPIPIPVLHGLGEGLDPVEYFAQAYGTRKGVVTTKLATGQAGFLGKQLANAAARLLITDESPLEGTGYPVETDDPDNEGAVLARSYGQFAAGSVLTPATLRKLKSLGHDEILVHSPISSGGRGVPKLAAGIRERRGWSPVGDNVGVAAAQSVSEQLSQAMLSSKHGAGVIGASREPRVGGFEAVDQLVNIPSTFKYAAAVASADGRVTNIEPAPQGGSYVWIGKAKHYVHADLTPSVKVGQEVEAGDSLSTGTPNPSEIVRYKHIGEGRRYLQRQLSDTLRGEGIRINRRNLELLSRGLVNHVRIVDPDGVGAYLPDDIVPYDDLASNYVPRDGHVVVRPSAARNKYLERPVLHYSVGTRVTPGVIKMLERHKVGNVTAHDDPPPFEPHMVRAVETTLYDPDFFNRLTGFYVGKGFLSAAQRGASSKIHGQSYGHALAESTGFGRDLTTKATY